MNKLYKSLLMAIKDVDRWDFSVSYSTKDAYLSTNGVDLKIDVGTCRLCPEIHTSDGWVELDELIGGFRSYILDHKLRKLIKLITSPKKVSRNSRIIEDLTSKLDGVKNGSLSIVNEGNLSIEDDV